MIFGATEIVICLAPTLLVIAVIGVWLVKRNNEPGDE